MEPSRGQTPSEGSATGVRQCRTGCEVAGHNRSPGRQGHPRRTRPTRERLPDRPWSEKADHLDRTNGAEPERRTVASVEGPRGRQQCLLRGFSRFPHPRFAGASSMNDCASRACCAAIVVAVPVASREACAALRGHVDACICVAFPTPFAGVGAWYDDFSETSDAEVSSLLAASRGAAPHARRRAHASTGTHEF